MQYFLSNICFSTPYRSCQPAPRVKRRGSSADLILTHFEYLSVKLSAYTTSCIVKGAYNLVFQSAVLRQVGSYAVLKQQILPIICIWMRSALAIKVYSFMSCFPLGHTISSLTTEKRCIWTHIITITFIKDLIIPMISTLNGLLKKKILTRKSRV